MKHYYFYILFLISLLHSPCYAQKLDKSISDQEKIDILIERLNQDIEDRRRIVINLRLVGLYKYAHPTVDSLIENSLELAKKNELPFYIARSLMRRARYRLYLNDEKEKIFADIQLIDSIRTEMPKNSVIPEWIDKLSSEYYLQTAQLDSAKKYLDRWVHTNEENEYSGRANYLTLQAKYHELNHDFQNAIKNYIEASENKNAGKAFIYNALGRLYLKMENPQKAIEYATKSMELSSHYQHHIPRIESLIILGDSYLEMGDTTRAIDYLEQAEANRNLPYYSKNYTAALSLFTIYSAQKNPKAKAIIRDPLEFKNTEIFPAIMVNKGRSLLDSNASEAKNWCQQGYDFASRKNDYAVLSEACACLSQWASSTGQLKLSNAYLQEQARYLEDMNNRKALFNMARNVSAYENEMEKKLLAQAAEKDKQIAQEKLNKYQLGIGMGIALLLLTLFTLFQLRKRNRRISAQAKIISKSLEEKEVLLREIHHRVKNNLQLVSSLLTLQGRTISDEVAIQAINEGRNRVRSMALIHQDLYNKEILTEVSVKEYISKLTEDLLRSYQIEDVDLRLNIEDIDLDIDTLIPLGLILNELITNALKYAYHETPDPILSIELKKNEQLINLIVSDNGKGYDPKEHKSNSFGSTLIQALTNQLQASLDINAENGTTTRLTFKESKTDG